MPWCPNCKAEYQEGFTVCTDCNVELVDNIEAAEVLVPLFQAEDKKVAEKLVKFLIYSDLNATLEFDEENRVYIVSVPPKREYEAKGLFRAFYSVERERMENRKVDPMDSPSEEEDGNFEDEDSSADDDPSDEASGYGQEYFSESDQASDEGYNMDTPSDEVTAFDDEVTGNNSAYVMKADQYKDLTSTVWVFLIFGVAGLCVVLLNIVGILNIFSGLFPNIVMAAMFLFFIYIAITTLLKAKKIKSEIEDENKLTEEINQWLKENITESFLTSIQNEGISKELNYIKMTDIIKDMLIEKFGSQNPAYLDRLIEEYYTENFDQEQE